ncbi:MAG: Asp-tRNA(Asn)/Glu-tRNA(Gln) amidotransferase subunit GatC [bacterium]
MINVEEVRKLAQLARIDMGEEELAKIAKEIGDILGYVDQIKTVAGEAEREVSAHHNITRDDNQPNSPGQNTETLAAEFPKREGNLLKVKKIL